ncbi:MAG: hypothetical protein AB7U30_04025 [Sulfuricellaceae bacterium]
MRQRLAQAAARIMAEDGIQDFSLAKRKAARQLGVEDGQHLPNNQEIEQELRLYQEIFQKEEQQERLRFLRKLALEVMRQLEPFNPRLTGSVLSGTATRYSDINLEVFPSSLKDVELFLLGRKIPYRSGEKTLRQGKDVRTVPLLALVELPATVEILVYDAEDLRSLPRTAADGKSPLRVKIHQVEAWLKGEAENHEG